MGKYKNFGKHLLDGNRLYQSHPGSIPTQI